MTGFITIREAADRLEVTRQAIYLMIKENRLRGAQLILEHWAVPEVEIERLIRERHQQEPEAA